MPTRLPLPAAALACLLAAAALAAPARAHEPGPVYDRVRLAASAGREVDTDTLVAIVYKEHQSTQQATAADEVNRAVAWAIELAKERGLEPRTFAYRTQPVYRDRHIQGWRVHQSIELESGDPRALAALLGDLQQRLSIQSLRNTLSPQTRARVEDALVVEALDAFQARARIVAQTLGRGGHRIVELDVSTSDAGDPGPVMLRAAGAESARAVAPPAVEGGRLRVEVRVSGAVELDAPAP